MIRSTLNESIKTITRLGIVGEGLETCITALGVTKAIDETAWDSEVAGTSVVHSNSHWDGTDRTL